MGLAVVLMRHMLQRRGRHQDVLLGRKVAHVVLVWGHEEAVGDVGWRGGKRRVDVLKGSPGNRLPSSHMAMVDVSLQVSLRQVCSLAALNNTTHEERASCTLLDPLHRVTTAEQGGKS